MINLEMFTKGFNMFGFYLAPDIEADADHISQTPKEMCALRLALKYHYRNM